MQREPLRDRAREAEALDRERLPRRHAVLIGARDHQRAGAPQLVLEQPGRRDRIVAAQRVRAHQLAAQRRLVGGRHRARLHLDQRDRQPGLGELPGGLAAGHAAADHGDVGFHHRDATTSWRVTTAGAASAPWAMAWPVESIALAGADPDAPR
jgi:hypothetical protein